MAVAKRKSSSGVNGARTASQASIGVIGGSGLYAMPGLTSPREIKVGTPFGEPSEAIVLGTLEGKHVAFLARHGRGHRILPGEINYRANIYAMKLLGVERIISVSAVGSLQEDLRPIRGSHAAADFHVFRRRPCGACVLRASYLRASVGSTSRCQRALRCQGASTRNVHLHGRPAVFHARGS
jgi:hypothetical protein